jgi:hypothetical protein
MSRLFHYTSVNGLRGIVDSGNIWATHLGFLNDLSEGSVLEAPLTRKFEQEFLAAFRQAEFAPWAKRLAGEDDTPKTVAAREARRLYRRLAAELDKRSPAFIASFCRHGEPHHIKNGLLSQWRGYAGIGGGYCAVFDEEALSKLVDEERRSAPGLRMIKKDILYVGDDEPVDTAIFDGVATRYLRALSSNEDSFFDDFETGFLDLLAFVKSEAFREENETRIMVAANGGARKIQFRDNSDLLIPFVEIFSRKRRLPITEIIVGPGPLAKRCAAGVTQFLRAHDLDIAVRISEIPLTM